MKQPPPLPSADVTEHLRSIGFNRDLLFTQEDYRRASSMTYHSLQRVLRALRDDPKATYLPAKVRLNSPGYVLRLLYTHCLVSMDQPPQCDD